MSQLIFKNAKVYDGVSIEPFKATVYCENTVIRKISYNRYTHDSKRSHNKTVIDATGLILAPGFIDVHTHSDASLLEDFLPAGKLAQGITTEIVGNCGLSPFPMTSLNRDNILKVYSKYPILSNFLTKKETINFADYNTLKSSLEKFSLVGYNTLRSSVAGYQQKKLSEKQIIQMKKLLRREIIAGAIGVSGGFLYTPGCYSTIEEISEVLSSVSDLNIIFCCHLRSESDEIIEAIEEMINVCRAAKVKKLHLSHLKIAKQYNWDKIDALFSLIDNCNDLQISFDRYPYIASQSSLSLTLPDKFNAMPDAQIQHFLQNKQNFSATLEMLKKYPKDYFSRIVLASTPISEFSNYCGQTIANIAKIFSNSTPAELLLTILRTDCNSTMGAFLGSMKQENMERIINDHRCLCGSDEVSRPEGFNLGRSHPRGFNSFPKFAAILAQKGYKNGEIIRRFSSKSAVTFNLPNIGAIKENYAANLILMDFKQYIRDSNNANFSAPHSLAKGIHGCWIKGQKVF
ncbi:amidohydrolase family protein [Lentisphaerota bacterium WC36G]|nr:amidohydrolase family protein [Lentisphaerae bacterium WC36]